MELNEPKETRRDVLDCGGPTTARVTLVGVGSTTTHATPVVGVYASAHAHRLLLSMDEAGRCLLWRQGERRLELAVPPGALQVKRIDEFFRRRISNPACEHNQWEAWEN